MKRKRRLSEEQQAGRLINAGDGIRGKSAEQNRQFFPPGTHHVPRWSIKQGKEQINSAHSVGVVLT